VVNWINEARKTKFSNIVDTVPDHAKERMAQVAIYFATKVAGPALVKDRPTPEIGAKLILGQTPKQIFPFLTTKEANDFCFQGQAPDPKDWLWARLRKKWPEIPETRTPSLAVIRWLEGIYVDPDRKAACERMRHGYLMGQNVDGSVLSRLDEIADVDIVPSPLETLERAAQRQAQAAWKGEDTLAEEYTWEKHLPEGVKPIRSFKELWEHGRAMRHCVASYASRIHEGENQILMITTEDGISTACIEKDKCVEHRCYANGDPTKSCKDLLAKALKVIQKYPNKESASRKRLR
jgi:hypothetical protein